MLRGFYFYLPACPALLVAPTVPLGPFCRAVLTSDEPYVLLAN